MPGLRTKGQHAFSRRGTRLLPVKATADQRLDFWQDQVRRLYEYYSE
jgi:hypothetical protein